MTKGKAQSIYCEQAYYPGAGLEKFAREEGRLWDEVFGVERTRVYKVE